MTTIRIKSGCYAGYFGPAVRIDDYWLVVIEGSELAYLASEVEVLNQ